MVTKFENLVSDEDEFQIETETHTYYYALQYALKNREHHWYKEDKNTFEINEVDPSEIVDLILNQPDKVIGKCPCVRTRDGKLVPGVEWY